MNEETFKIICRAFFPHCEFSRSPLGTIRATIDEDGHKWRIATYEDFGQYGNRFLTYPIPGLRTSELYSALYRQKFKKIN